MHSMYWSNVKFSTVKKVCECSISLTCKPEKLEKSRASQRVICLDNKGQKKGGFCYFFWEIGQDQD